MIIPNTTAIMLDGGGKQTEKYFSLYEQMKKYTEKSVIFTSNEKYSNTTNYNYDQNCKIVYFNKKLDYQDFAKFTIFNFYRFCDTKFYMTYHLDGYILNSDKWNDEFLNYDWISSPWPFEWKYPWVKENKQVGNGGFSLRSVEMMKAVAAIANHTNYNGCVGEDVYTCSHLRNCLEESGFQFAPTELAKQFSVENPLDCGKDCGHYPTNTFGFHGKHWMDILKENKYWIPE